MNRRTQILRRAAELFQHQGVSGTSLEDIANAVGIKREGIYHYFKGRIDILLEIILPESRALAQSLRRILATNLTGEEKLHAAIENHLERFNPSYLEMSVALREDHFARNEVRLKELRTIWSDYETLWSELVETGQKDGSYDPGLSPKAVVYGILGMCNWLSRWYDPAGPLSIDDIIETYFAMVFHGLGARRPD